MTDSAHSHAAARRVTWPLVAAVAALLGLYVLLALSASLQKGLSYDEGEHIAIGYNIWLRHDLRMEAANGDFVKRWAALPLLLTKPAFPTVEDPYWRADGAYEVAYLFFFEQGNGARFIMLQCRAMVAILGVVTGLLVFFCSRSLFGNFGGLISLGLFVFSPSMLAFGGIVTTEMSVCLTLLGSTWFIWLLLHRVTWSRLAGSLIFFGLLVLSKPSAIVMFPVTAVMLAARFYRGQPLEWFLGTRRPIRSRRAQAAIFSGLIALHGLSGWLAIWAHYDFRYLASPNPGDPGIVFKKQKNDAIEPAVAVFFDWSRKSHFLPEGYIHGVEWLLGQNESQAAFMDGEWTYGGWRTFFPYAMWVKTPPAMGLLCVAGLLGWWRLKRRGGAISPEAAGGFFAVGPVPPLYDAVPFVALATVYLGIAVVQDLNIGFRHVLPVYPAIYVLGGSAALWWAKVTRWGRVGLALIMGGLVVDSLKIFPHFLAYFSPVAGGPAQGYKRLVDSSLDWGMDLPGLRQWIEEHNPGDREPFFFAYFGTGNPDYYKIKSRRLPSRPEWRLVEVYPLTPGIYAISATLLQGIGTQTVGPWNKAYEKAYQECFANLKNFEATAGDLPARAALLEKYTKKFWDEEYARFEKLRFGRLCAWLRNKRVPDDSIGYSILIWKLDAKALDEAMLGPPAELAEAPLRL